MQRKTVSLWFSRRGLNHHNQIRQMVTGKTSNRASVHGIRLPVPDQVEKDEVEKDIRNAKEERENKRKEVEKVVDSELKKANKPYSTIE